MTCTPLALASGVRAIVCHRRRIACACGRAAAFQCDAPTRRKSGTCDKHLCVTCATEVGPDRHLCPAHAHTDGARKPEVPRQEALF